MIVTNYLQRATPQPAHEVELRLRIDGEAAGPVFSDVGGGNYVCDEHTRGGARPHKQATAFLGERGLGGSPNLRQLRRGQKHPMGHGAMFAVPGAGSKPRA